MSDDPAEDLMRAAAIIASVSSQFEDHTVVSACLMVAGATVLDAEERKGRLMKLARDTFRVLEDSIIEKETTH